MVENTSTGSSVRNPNSEGPHLEEVLDVQRETASQISVKKLLKDLMATDSVKRFFTVKENS